MKGVQYDKYYKPQEQQWNRMVIDTLKTTQARYMLQPAKNCEND
ncbi:11368_t:CDS:2 [Funneliformis geosporum]|uniref:14966_t:CDS:1 n=1 Tax=Funneliformis geosporum TaxID=1117311 RepID=A0A9W4SHN3_9GLOM|nr:11368_t:CDS:2 [Funneliformis geosporum]CAI2170086.1 14966_t:CDS:2 [Funneliformis geosporum]